MKKTILIITTLVFITSLTFTQSKVNINSLKMYDGKAFKMDDDKPYTGRVFDLYESTGKKIFDGKYRNGLKNGKWTKYWEDGKIKGKVSWKDGIPYGRIIGYYL